MTTPPFDPPSAADIATVSAQLGRPARNVLGIAARCICGAPTVVATAPRLDDGTPFPTLYYLSHPAATAAMSDLEAT
ncbi:MAG: septum formation initiator family protein, partial [Subtercola sp.]|nr:septum formation initiator family protein [Subtercola sp.]